jgi:hypothetical protein
MKIMEMATLAELRKLRKEVAGLTKKIDLLLAHPPGQPCPVCRDNGSFFDHATDRIVSCRRCSKGTEVRRDFPDYDLHHT